MSVFLGEVWKEKEGRWTQSPLEWEPGEMLPQDQVRSGCLMAAEKRQWLQRPGWGLLEGRGLCLLCLLFHPEGLGQVTAIHKHSLYTIIHVF